ncbi:MAG TPA: hypothetical protein PLR99_03430 [Polyangiaceae bacterium]|nr:hypothetical protein [Polyangiaceae bacterium]
MVFPATGPFRAHQGMFVGEVHDDRATMEVFLRRLRGLGVHVILLEYYPEGETPHLRSEDQIVTDLVRFNKTFDMGPLIAKQIFRLWSLAYYFGIEVRGIEQPTPLRIKPGSVQYLLHRLGDPVNQAFLDCADKYAVEKRKQGVRFCMYGGLVHWVKLKKLAPGLPGYKLDDTKTALVPIP